jgi:hypothetical protein
MNYDYEEDLPDIRELLAPGHQIKSKSKCSIIREVIEIKCNEMAHILYLKECIYTTLLCIKEMGLCIDDVMRGVIVKYVRELYVDSKMYNLRVMALHPMQLSSNAAIYAPKPMKW